jgi:hypothetical protein
MDPSSRASPGCLEHGVAVGGSCPRCGSTSSVCEKGQTSPLLPHGARTSNPAAFPLQMGNFLGTTTGAMMAITDPSGGNPSRLAAP